MRRTALLGTLRTATLAVLATSLACTTDSSPSQAPDASGPTSVTAPDRGEHAPVGIAPQTEISATPQSDPARPVDVEEAPVAELRPHRRERLDVLHRRRHGVVQQHAPVPRERSAPADRRRAHRGAGQLLLVRVRSPVGRPLLGHTETAHVRGTTRHMLVSIGLQGQLIDQSETPARNLVFLLDVSGSMNRRTSCRCSSARGCWSTTPPRDRVSIVVYAGASGVVLEPTPGDEQDGHPRGARPRSRPGGSTNGGAGIELAYEIAQARLHRRRRQPRHPRHRRRLQRRRHERGDLVRLIETKRQEGVFLSVLGFGMGNLKDSTLEKLADKGNGNYAYIDSLTRPQGARRADRRTLVTIAKDVKIQVEFNPAGRGLSPDRLREPPARRQGRTSTTTPRTPARSAPATRDGAVRGRASSA
jgi:hypothetical protein